jgi:excisionase family DNA binding protein
MKEHEEKGGAALTCAALTYTVDEVAKLLRLNRNGVYGGIANREIPAIRIGRRLLIPKAAIDRMMSGETGKAA